MLLMLPPQLLRFVLFEYRKRESAWYHLRERGRKRAGERKEKRAGDRKEKERKKDVTTKTKREKNI